MSRKWTLDEIKKTGLAFTDGRENGQSVRNTARNGKESKFKNVKKWYKDMHFDSVKEMSRYIELEFLQSIGEISGLRRQVVYQLSVCKYIADHVYFDKSGIENVEDVKSKYTRTLAVYRLKKKMMLNELNIEIKET